MLDKVKVVPNSEQAQTGTADGDSEMQKLLTKLNVPLEVLKEYLTRIHQQKPILQAVNNT